MDLKKQRILVTGGAGFLGKYVVKELVKKGVNSIRVPRSKEFDLRERSVCEALVKESDIVIHLAAKVGGIGLNQKKPGELFYDNLIMGVQLMEAARKAKIKKFVSIGTVCSYPKTIPLPFKEEDLWQGYPEETNAAYGLAKKMLLVQGQAYHQQYGFNAIYLLPVNLYGPGDNFNEASSHVIPALIKKFVEAKRKKLKQVEVWGTGSASREFLYVTDAAEAIVLATEQYEQPDPINLGSHNETSIKDLAQLLKELIGYQGKIIWDSSKPDGQPRRKFDTSKAKKEFGFESKTSFKEGLQRTLEWYAARSK